MNSAGSADAAKITFDKQLESNQNADELGSDLKDQPTKSIQEVPVPAVKKLIPNWAKPPWPEWSDSVINRETWEENESIEVFEDPAGAIEPNSVKPSNWIRPADLFLEQPKLVDWTVPIIDLITPNSHLCEISETVRFILSEMSELYDFGVANEFLLEGEGVAFVTNSKREGISWKPWDHIYSCCKAGVTGERPVFNHMGKYYVRLYYLGCWRRITVDDRIPLLQNGRIGLPITNKNELWPLILTKALVKVASLSWDIETNSEEIKKFSAISALTGWISEWVSVRDPITSSGLWNELLDILPKYKRPVVTTTWTGEKKKKSEVPDENDALWWNAAAGDKEDDTVEYQEYSDSDKGISASNADADLKFSFASTSEIRVHHHHHHHASKKRQLDSKKKSRAFKSLSKIRDEKFPDDIIPPQSEDASEEKKHNSKNNKKTKKSGMSKNSAGKVNAKDVKKNKKEGKKGKDTVKKNVESNDNTNAVTDDNEDSKSTKDEAKEVTKAKGNKKKAQGTKEKDKKKKEVRSNKDKDDLEIPGKKKSGRGNKKLRGSNKQQSSEEEAEPIGEPELEVTESETFSSAETKAAYMYRHPKRAESKREDGDKNKKKQNSNEHKTKIPHMQEIVLAVQKYSGIENHSLITAWESISGKSIPIALTVILKNFPEPEEGTQVPSFMYHPIQLLELRDVPLFKQSDRPATPRWKTFRWKAWAMEKGIIPIEKDLSQEVVRCIKVRTPFVLKKDWYVIQRGLLQNEFLGEFGGEDGDDEYLRMRQALIDAKVGVESVPPPVPPSTSVQADTICGGGTDSGAYAYSDKRAIGTNIKSSTTIGASKNNGKDGMASSIRIPDKLIPDAQRSSVLKKYGSTNEGSIIKSNNSGAYVTDDEEWPGESTTLAVDTELKPAEEVEVAVEVLPSEACGTLWFHNDNLAPSIKKFCKFFSSRTTFGSCFILRRSQDWLYNDRFTTTSPTDAAHELGSSPKPLRKIFDYHAIPGSENLTVKFEALKTVNITPYHLDQSQGIESAFYLFSDCWTEQEIVITLEVLQEMIIKKFTERAQGVNEKDQLKESRQSQAAKQGIPYSANISFTLEPWDWRNDCCLETPLIYSSTKSSWATHLILPPGRNTFRIWLMEDLLKPDGSRKRKSSFQRSRATIELQKRTPVPFVLKFVSKTPIHIGSREEIQNYMTNEPVLFLKQCERLAQNIWTMFLLFGKGRNVYTQNLTNLRKSYCPSYSEPNVINKRLKKVHTTFENYFVSMIVGMNKGVVDGPMLLALKCLLMNPHIGHGYSIPQKSNVRSLKRDFDNLLKSYRKQKKYAVVNSAAITIQRYCRGWLVRRLFHIRIRGHKNFLRIEYQVRKLAYLLAQHTDSTFNQDVPVVPPVVPPQKSSLGLETGIPDEKEAEEPEKPSSPPTLIPNPPKWAVNLLRHLLEVHPLLVSIHPHAYCTPHHVKITEIEGNLPFIIPKSNWLPFFRQVAFVPGQSKWCYCMIDLQVYPANGIVLKIINNDTRKCLVTSTDRIFLGRLRSNKNGYTVLCYRWAVNVKEAELPSNQWKIRIITPNIQESLVFKDENMSMPDGVKSIPKNLCLRRFTGYYIPNRDFSICRYTMETEETSSHLSIRFKTNYENVKVRLQIWDLTSKTLAFEHTANGGFLIPSLLIEKETLEKSESKNGLNGPQDTMLRSFQASDVGLGAAEKLLRSEPSFGFTSNNSQRYAISIFVVDNSWPLTDRQWVFVHHKRRKFFKKLRKWSFKEFRNEQRQLKKQQQEARDRAAAALKKRRNGSSGTVNDGDVHDQLDDATIKSKGRKGRKHRPDQNNQIINLEATPSIHNTTKDKPDAGSETLSQPQQPKSKGKSKKGKKDKDQPLEQEDSPLLKNTVKEETFEQLKKSRENLKKECRHKKHTRDHKHEIKKQITANLTVKSGGRHSQNVGHASQPQWLFEIVTEADKKYKFINSREVFKQQLRDTKKEWEAKGKDRLSKALSSRRNYLLRHLVPINYKAENPFSFVDPSANFYSCLNLEKYDLDGYKESKFIKCLQRGWKKLKKLKKSTLLRRLETLKKMKEAKTDGKRVIKIDSRFKRKENGILLKRLKRLPRMLSKRREEWLKYQEEMAEKERIEEESIPFSEIQLQEVGSGFNVESVVSAHSGASNGKKKKAKAKRNTEKDVNVLEPATSEVNKKKRGKKESKSKDDAKTDIMSNSNQEKITSKRRLSRKKKGTEGSLMKMPMEGGSAHEKRRKSLSKKEQIKHVETVAPPSEHQIGVEGQQSGVSNHRHKSKIKRQIIRSSRAKTIRDGLLTASQLAPATGLLVRVKRSGADKYCQLKTENVPTETETKESNIADRLLNWAFNYNCMKKEADEDPTCGACADELFLSKETVHPQFSGLRNTLLNRRHTLPPPRRPTHVLIGPKISKCGLDTSKEQRRRLEGETPWTVRNRLEERRLREDGIKKWENTYKGMYEVFENFKTTQNEEKNKFVEDVYNAALNRLKTNRDNMKAVRENYVEHKKPLNEHNRSKISIPSVCSSSDSVDSWDEIDVNYTDGLEGALSKSQYALQKSASKAVVYDTEETTDSVTSSGTCSDWDDQENDNYVNYLQLAMASRSFSDVEEETDNYASYDEEDPLSKKRSTRRSTAEEGNESEFDSGESKNGFILEPDIEEYVEE